MSPRAERLRAYVVSLVLTAMVCEPAFRDPNDDGFPASTYPMFSRERSAVARISHVVAVSEDGRRRALPPRIVANDEVMQAHATVRKTVRRGKRASAELCESVARRVASRGGALADVRRVEVRTDRYDAVAYFSGDREPLRSKVHARCRVPRAREDGP